MDVGERVEAEQCTPIRVIATREGQGRYYVGIATEQAFLTVMRGRGKDGETMGDLPIPCRLYIAGSILVGIITATAAAILIIPLTRGTVATVPLWQLVVFVAAGYLAVKTEISVGDGAHITKFDLAEILNVALIIVFPWPVAVVCSLASNLMPLASPASRSQYQGRIHKYLFNLSDTVLLTGLVGGGVDAVYGVGGLLVARPAGDPTPLLGAAAAVVLYQLVNALHVVGVVALAQRVSPVAVWMKTVRPFVWITLAKGSVGVLVAAVWTFNPALAIIFVVPALAQVRATGAMEAARARANELAVALEAAMTDVLTGLPNRRAVAERLAAELAEGRRSGTRTSIVFIDLDRFKPINDLHGHDAGDAALRAVADALRAATRPGDIPARLAGDEFVVILPRKDGAEAHLVGERLHEVLNPLRISYKGAALEMGASIGVATSAEGEDADGLLKKADAATYAAKRAGRGRMWVADDPDVTRSAAMSPMRMRIGER